jgi:class 3 adenylate cyclase
MIRFSSGVAALRSNIARYIHGDGVNIAARLESIAEPGGICISEDAFRQVSGKVDAEFADTANRASKTSPGQYVSTASFCDDRRRRRWRPCRCPTSRRSRCCLSKI